MKKSRCEECVFFEKPHNESCYGECHRYPYDSMISEVTHVKPDDWCGEFVDVNRKQKERTKDAT